MTILRAPRMRRLLLFAVAVIVLVVAPLIWKGDGGDSTAALTGPAAATEVPTKVPERGVDINSQVVLLPPRVTDVAALDRDQAFDAANRYGKTGDPPTALLARVTVPGTIPPPDSPVPFDTIEDRLAWVITYTSDEPVNVGHSKAGGTPGQPPLLVSHFSVVLDAGTGAFLIRFYTD